MSSPLELAVCRIFKLGSEDDVAGSGFLVSAESKYILTCAHVINYALYRSPEIQDKPDEDRQITVDFPNLYQNGQSNLLKTRVIDWEPVKSGVSLQDIAVLEILDDLPAKAQALSLILTESQTIKDNNYEAYGFPTFKGRWSEGTIQRPVSDGQIQLKDPSPTGIAIEAGFSGTAVWDKSLNGVVGMVVQYDLLHPEAKVAFMTPVNVLVDVGNLKKVCEINGRIQEVLSLLEGYFQQEEYYRYICFAYQQSISRYSHHYSPSNQLHDMLNSLEGDRDDSLAKFMGNLFIAFQNDTRDLSRKLCKAIKKWIKLHGYNFEEMLAELSSKRNRLLEQDREIQGQTNESCILIEIDGSKGAWRVKAWIIEDKEKYRKYRQQYRENKQMHIDKFPGIHLLTDEEQFERFIDIKKDLDIPINLLRRKAYNKLYTLSLGDSLITSIHCFLPIPLIASLALDKSIVENYSQEPSFGHKYKISLGLTERLVPTGNERISLWHKKGNIFNRYQQDEANNLVTVVDNSRPRKLSRKLEKINGASLRIAMNECNPEVTMQILMETGIPLALWLRENPENLDCCGTTLHHKVCQCSLEKLPEKVKEQRSEAWAEECPNHIGNHLSLLWDDPDLVPPDYVRRMP
ncbi:trypsin-like peptidase domain-containing protein [Roseofilum casamattae]|uniref:Trypsin-like peptidase domain-containing protein n=1 Tax=Roseofilum casamattae BLCC-M143 TaxID=3022442 RepID=A0ABT7BZL4_9CYAN|nr:trypsin-like peptidase domain-containing protein [Roseofilum casamattae]MDJ1184650.1 trypsin-like peptidase domain-containing protein [Roseofilum casamattae BLCC-M143]